MAIIQEERYLPDITVNKKEYSLISKDILNSITQLHMKEFMLYILPHVIQKKSRKTKIGCCKSINVHAVKTFSVGLSYL